MQLRAWCDRMGYVVVREYVDHESGAKGADQRKQFGRLFVDAARREFDMVLVWALDRFSRNGMASTIVDLQRLGSYGVTFHSFNEPHLSTDNELVRDVLLAVLASSPSSSGRRSVNAPRPGSKGLAQRESARTAGVQHQATREAARRA